MKKLHYFLACAFVACLTLVLFSSCEEERGFAPKSIVGKTLKSEWPTPIKFISETECWYTSYSTAYTTYTYTKVSDNVGVLKIDGCFDHENGEYFLGGWPGLSLTFTSKDAGWYNDGDFLLFTLY